MNWFDILKKKKGKYVSTKVLNELKQCLNELDGVEVEEVTVTRKGHYQFRAKYIGEELPPKQTEVKFIVTTGLPDKHISLQQSCAAMKTNARKALARKNVFILW
tara:strand:+ start:13575 stop:13886 length:312 start_codon:yes stop_codon:yes gene_type:complete